MTIQRLHSAMAPIDILTRGELLTANNQQVDAAIRERYRGLDSVRFPQLSLPGTGGTLNLGSSGLENNVGPEQGDVWLIRRVNVVSTGYTFDPARYILFKSSDPTNYNSRYLLDAISFQQSSAYSVITGQPAVPASNAYQFNYTNQPYSVVITGGTVTGVLINGLSVGTGDGTYIVPAGAGIAITYSVAPTWQWNTIFTQGVQTTPGQLVNVAYNSGNKAGLVMPGEQVYAQVYNTNAGQQYSLVGEAIRVPAEMKGKVIG
jgi:hypothetical protein